MVYDTRRHKRSRGRICPGSTQCLRGQLLVLISAIRVILLVVVRVTLSLVARGKLVVGVLAVARERVSKRHAGRTSNHHRRHNQGCCQ